MGRKRVRYVTEPLSGGAGGDQHLVVADDPAVLRALKRLGRRRRDVTKQVLSRAQARQAHESRPVREAVALSKGVRRRRPIDSDVVEGEVGLVESEGRELLVFHEQRLLCRDTLDGPPSFSAAVASPRLEPRRDVDRVQGHTGAVGCLGHAHQGHDPASHGDLRLLLPYVCEPTMDVHRQGAT